MCNFAPKKTLDDGFFYVSLGYLIFKFKSKCANKFNTSKLNFRIVGFETSLK
jgi:hypothetical protein